MKFMEEQGVTDVRRINVHCEVCPRDHGKVVPGVTLPPCRGLWGTLHIGDDIDCHTCPHPGVPRVESHLFTVGGFLVN